MSNKNIWRPGVEPNTRVAEASDFKGVGLVYLEDGTLWTHKASKPVVDERENEILYWELSHKGITYTIFND